MLDVLKSYLRMTSWPVITAMAALMIISVLAVGAAEQADPKSRVLSGLTRKQTVNAVIAAAAFVGVTLVHYQRIGRAAYVLFALNLVLLVAVLVLGQDPVRGTQRWLDLKVVKVQPSELIKVTYVLTMAWYLRYRENYRRFRGLLLPFGLTGLPFVLILIEPDLGTSLLLFPTLFFMLFLAGAKLRHLLGVIAAAAVLALLPVPRDLSRLPAGQAEDARSLAYWSSADGRWAVSAAPLRLMKQTQLRRIRGWLGQSDPQVAYDEGFQLCHSMIILSSCGVYGQRGSPDMNLYYRVLPDDHTDFIYAVIGGQWGFVGCAGVLVVYLAVFVCGVEIASATQDPFGRLLAVGVLALLLAQVFINLAMTMGLMPITGMTLPLLSYGGSSLLANALALGLLVNVGQRRPVLIAKKPFEYAGTGGDEPLRASRLRRAHGQGGRD